MTDFTPHEAPATDVQALPVMHPGRPVGRDDVLKDVYNHLQDRKAVLIKGASGVGKTALAAALAAAYTQQPGGVLWLSTGTHPLPALLVQIGRALAVREVTTTEQPAAHIGAVATAITDRKPFIVLDNVTDALSPSQLVNKAADGTPLVLLSETELEGPWEVVSLEALADLDAVMLFKQKAGITNSDHDIDIYGIAKLLQYKPLPIVIAARGMVAAKQNPATYLQNLTQVAGSINDPAMAAIGLSYRSLNNALQGLMLMLGATFSGEASIDFLSAVSGVPEEGLAQATTILAQLYLVEKFTRSGKPYYRLHPSVYQFAQGALKGKNQLDGLQQKVQQATLAYVRANASQSDVNATLLTKEMANIIATAQAAAQNGNRDLANQIVDALTQANGFVQERGYVYELLNLRHLGSGQTQAFPAYEPAQEFGTGNMAAVVAEEDDTDDFDIDDDALEDFEYDDDFDVDDLNDEDEQAQIDLDPAILNSERAKTIDVEQLRIALNQARQQGERPRQEQILKAIGKVLVSQEKETEAIATYNELLELYEADSDDNGTLETLNMLAALLTRTGNTQAAVMHATRGLDIAAVLDEQAIRQQLFVTLGDARQDLGETDAAVDSFANALEITRQTGDSQNEAIALYKLGYAHLDNGATDDAIHSLEQARELFKAQSKRNYEGRVLGGLGSAHSDLGRWGEAIGYYQSALHIAREVGDKAEEGLQLSNLGQAQVESGRLKEALLSYRQALHLAYMSGKREDIVSAIVDLVRLMLRSDRLLAISDLLLQDAIDLEPDDRDVKDLDAQIRQRLQQVNAAGKQLAPVEGTAKQYAANAYTLLEA